MLINSMTDFEINRDKLSKWLDRNIINFADDLFDTLQKANIINYEDIENLYEYDEDTDEHNPKEILAWYIITEEAYEKFKKIDFCVLKVNELCLFGRTIHGQTIMSDFHYVKDKINIILDL